MPDQAIAFAPLTAPNLAGLRAGQVVSYAGTLYDVEQVEFRETLGGRDHNTGAPLAIETRVDVKLDRATWTEKPWLEAPADVFVLPELQGERKTVINGQAYWLSEVRMNRAYLSGFRRSPTPEEEVPLSIELQLVRNPHEDPVIGIKCICDEPPGVGEKHEQRCPMFTADIERWADQQESDHA